MSPWILFLSSSEIYFVGLWCPISLSKEIRPHCNFSEMSETFHRCVFKKSCFPSVLRQCSNVLFLLDIPLVLCHSFSVFHTWLMIMSQFSMDQKCSITFNLFDLRKLLLHLYKQAQFFSFNPVYRHIGIKRALLWPRQHPPSAQVLAQRLFLLSLNHIFLSLPISFIFLVDMSCFLPGLSVCMKLVCFTLQMCCSSRKFYADMNDVCLWSLGQAIDPTLFTDDDPWHECFSYLTDGDPNT